MSNIQLLAAVGTGPETLWRTFQQLNRVDAVETRERTMVTRDRGVLERIAGIR